MALESFAEQMGNAVTLSVVLFELSVTVHYDSRQGGLEPLFGVLPHEEHA